MNRSRQKYWAQYARALADRLNLQDWIITIKDEPANEESYAEVRCLFGKMEAEIRLAKDFDSFPREQQRYSVTHELIHVHQFGVTNLICDGELDVILGKPAYTVLCDAFTFATERACHGLTIAVAQFMPFPRKQ